jgi:hypothetical protein
MINEFTQVEDRPVGELSSRLFNEENRKFAERLHNKRGCLMFRWIAGEAREHIVSNKVVTPCLNSTKPINVKLLVQKGVAIAQKENTYSLER